MSKGQLYILSGPSGSGKDTVLQEFFKIIPDVKFSISCVTRPMREGETQDGKYHFISREQFVSMIENDELLEYNEYVGNFYGTPKAPVNDCVSAGEDMILEIDINGAKKVKEKVPEAVSIFIMPPSFSELRRRLSSRGTDSAEVIERRLNTALREIQYAHSYDYIVVNDNVSVAAQDIAHIILSQRLKHQRQKQIIDEVLEKC